MTVSVVIPCRDDSAELARCLAALSEQTRPGDEVIVVDNNSTDDSAETARRWGATVVSCLDPGIPAASSRGYDAASGDLLLRLDADCIPPPSWIADVIAAFARHPEAGAVSGPARFHDGPALLRRPLAALYLAAYAFTAVPALGHRPLFGSNFAMRREAWESVRGSVHRADPELHDDLDLSFHIGAHHRIRRLRGAPMTMSMRPFSNARAFVRRSWRGVHTIAAHWPEDFPPYRWRRILRRERAGLRGGSDEMN